MDATGSQKELKHSTLQFDIWRYPLTIKLAFAKQVVSYYSRLDSFDAAGEQSLARHAFVEHERQRTNNFCWHNSINKIMQIAGYSCKDVLACPTRIRSNLESHFNTLCDNHREPSHHGVCAQNLQTRVLKNDNDVTLVLIFCVGYLWAHIK